jgi:hypothetical protein
MRFWRSRLGLPGIAITGTAMVMALIALGSSSAFAQRPVDSPFAALQGSWSGSGTIALSNGTKERIRCRATYRLGSSSANLRLDLSCEGDSSRFELDSQISYRDGSLSGTWGESTRATGGSIDGRATGNQIQVRADGQTFTALLSMTTRGDRQSISIQSPGSQMSDVTIALIRGLR